MRISSKHVTLPYTYQEIIESNVSSFVKEPFDINSGQPPKSVIAKRSIFNHARTSYLFCCEFAFFDRYLFRLSLQLWKVQFRTICNIYDYQFHVTIWTFSQTEDKRGWIKKGCLAWITSISAGNSARGKITIDVNILPR